VIHRVHGSGRVPYWITEQLTGRYIAMNLDDLASRKPIPVLPEPRERGRLRRVFGITQAQLGEALGVSRQTIIGYERGVSEPTGKRRADYAAVLTAWAETENQEK
jgi:DNA-binding XRE family transcriptional regulator